MRRLGLLLLCAFCYLGTALAGDVLVAYPFLAGDTDLERELNYYSNLERNRLGLGTLFYDEKLALAARHHAWEMARLNYFSHESPNPETATLARRVARAGSGVQAIGENLAFLSARLSVAADAVEGWMNSPSHRANLLKAEFTHVGFGIATDMEGNHYVVQVLAAQPYKLEDSLIQRQTLSEPRLDLELSLTQGTDVGVFVGNALSEALYLGPGYHQLMVDAPEAEQVHVQVGVRSGSQSYILQDEGWIELASGYWRGGITAPKDYVAIENVQPSYEQTMSYRIELALSGPSGGELGIWIDNERLREVDRFGDTLSFKIAADQRKKLIDVGLRQADGRFNIVLSYELVPGPIAHLQPRNR